MTLNFALGSAVFEITGSVLSLKSLRKRNEIRTKGNLKSASRDFVVGASYKTSTAKTKQTGELNCRDPSRNVG